MHLWWNPVCVLWLNLKQTSSPHLFLIHRIVAEKVDISPWACQNPLTDELTVPRVDSSLHFLVGWIYSDQHKLI